MELILTPKQQKFCDEYLTDMNATRAALRAGYSASTALSGALMRIPKIAAYLQQHREKASKAAQINHQMVLAELGKIAFSNMANYYHNDGSLKGMHELTADEAAALWCLKVTDGENGQSAFIRLNNKLSALEKIARHLGFYDIAEAEVPEKEYVVIDKDELTDDDLFEDNSFDEPEEEEEEEYDEFEGETEQERIWRMESERYKLLHFYPKLDEFLPEGKYLTDAIITQALQDFTIKKRNEPWWIGEMRAGLDPTLLAGQKIESPTMEGGERSRTLDNAEKDAAVQERVGGVIDFGVKEAEEPKKPSGRCEVPLMMGNSKEYGYW